jgi:hypothetical protein
MASDEEVVKVGWRGGLEPAILRREIAGTIPVATASGKQQKISLFGETFVGVGKEVWFSALCYYHTGGTWCWYCGRELLYSPQYLVCSSCGVGIVMRQEGYYSRKVVLKLSKPEPPTLEWGWDGRVLGVALATINTPVARGIWANCEEQPSYGLCRMMRGLGMREWLVVDGWVFTKLPKGVSAANEWFAYWRKMYGYAEPNDWREWLVSINKLLVVQPKQPYFPSLQSKEIFGRLNPFPQMVASNVEEELKQLQEGWPTATRWLQKRGII